MLKRLSLLSPSYFGALFSVLFICPCILNAQDSGLDGILDEFHLAGMSVLTRCGNEISIEHHAGLRDIGNKLPVDSTTTYRVASISKAVVALLAAKLAEQGVIGYDVPIGHYLEDPPFHPAHPNLEITMGQLLTHRSGIRDGTGYSDFLNDTYASIPEVPVLTSVLNEGGSHYTSDMWGASPPGEWFQYANLNYGVAATILESATGMRFDLLMTEMLFAPYGLDAGYKVQDLQDIGSLAVLYRQVNGAWAAQADNFGGVMPDGVDWSQYVPGTNALGFAPQGGLRIGARDLSILARLWSHGSAPDAEGMPLTFLGTESLGQLMAPQWSFDGSNGNNYYGLFNQWSNGLHLAASGWGDDSVIPELDLTPMPGHPGEAYGLISDAYATPDGNWNCVFITNGKWDGYTSGPASAFYAVEQAVFASLRDDALACVTAGVPEVPSIPVTVLGSPRSGDTLIQIQVGAGYQGVFEFVLRDSAGRITCSDTADAPDGGGRAMLNTHALQPGIHMGTLSAQGGSVFSRFVFLVPG